MTRERARRRVGVGHIMTCRRRSPTYMEGFTVLSNVASRDAVVVPLETAVPEVLAAEHNKHCHTPMVTQTDVSCSWGGGSLTHLWCSSNVAKHIRIYNQVNTSRIFLIDYNNHGKKHMP